MIGLPDGQVTTMLVTDHLEAITDQAAALAAAAEAAGPDARVPSCPDWTVRDLVRHTGGVHRWATAHVRDAVPELITTDLEELSGGWPTDSELVAWFRTGASELVATLHAAPQDLSCATFLAAPSPLAMWARRQAHETTIHRVDAQLATGTPPDPLPADLAADGIDELLTCFLTRPHRGPRRDTAYRLLVRPTDHATAWLVSVTDGDTEVTRIPEGADADADLTIGGTASDIDLLLWNRATADGLDLSGDTSLLTHWRTQVQVRWR